MQAEPRIPEGAKQLEIRAKCVYEDDQLLDHLRSSMRRKIPHFMPTPQHDHEIACVGSAPSVRNFVEEIRALKERGVYIMAIKAAHDFLIGHGIIPHMAIAVDPQPHIKKCFQKKRQDVFYFLASQCHPELFDFFDGHKVVLWHLLTGKEGEKEAINNEPALGGGSTSGMRAMTLSWAMGFRKINLFGYDSCLSGTELKIDGTTHEEPPLKLWIHGREFDCNPPMAAQVTEFEKVLNAFKGHVQVRVHGDGAIPWLAKLRGERQLPDIALDGFKPIHCHKDYWTV